MKQSNYSCYSLLLLLCALLGLCFSVGHVDALKFVGAHWESDIIDNYRPNKTGVCSTYIQVAIVGSGNLSILISNNELEPMSPVPIPDPTIDKNLIYRFDVTHTGLNTVLPIGIKVGNNQLMESTLPSISCHPFPPQTIIEMNTKLVWFRDQFFGHITTNKGLFSSSITGAGSQCYNMALTSMDDPQTLIMNVLPTLVANGACNFTESFAVTLTLEDGKVATMTPYISVSSGTYGTASFYPETRITQQALPWQTLYKPYVRGMIRLINVNNPVMFWRDSSPTMASENNVAPLEGNKQSAIYVFGCNLLQEAPTTMTLDAINEPHPSSPLATSTYTLVKLLQLSGSGYMYANIEAFDLAVSQVKADESMTFMINQDLKTRQPPFPYGYTGPIFKTSTFGVQVYVSKYCNELEVNYASSDPASFEVIVNSDSSYFDIIPPTIVSIDVMAISTYIQQFTVVATDDKSGVWRLGFKIGNQDSILINQSYIVGGSSLNCTFRFQVDLMDFPLDPKDDPRYFITVYDIANNQNTFNSADYLPSLNYPGTLKSPVSWKFGDFTSFKFDQLQVTVTNKSANNVLYFNVTNADQSAKPKFALNPYNSLDTYIDSLVFEGAWDSSAKMYKIPFTVPMNVFEGRLSYTLFSYPYFRDYHMFRFFKVSGTLTVTSAYADLKGPVISNVVAFPSTTITQIDIQQGITVGWNITISDPTNGFKEGYVEITSNYDPVPTRVDLNQHTRTTGDDHLSTHFISFQPLPASRTQNYTFKAYLKDKTFNVASNLPLQPSVNGHDRLYVLDPFIYSQDFGYTNQLAIQVTYPPAITDFDPPKVSPVYNHTLSIDVGSNDRSFYITFTVTDDASGVLLKNLPMVYISSSISEVIGFQATLVKSDPMSPVYTVNGKLPYAFGSLDLLFISIYGMYDNNLNMGGRPMHSTIQRTFSLGPVLESHSSIEKNGGEITVTGQRLGLDRDQVSIKLLTKEGSISVTPTVFTPTKIVFIIPPFTYIDPVYRLTVTDALNSLVSNTLTIAPNQPICPGSPLICSGHGDCLDNNQCLCAKGWSGDSCSEPLVPECPGNCSGHGTCLQSGCSCEPNWYGINCFLIKPIIDNTSPNVTLETTDQTYTTFSAFISLDELDSTGVMVEQYSLLPPRNWSYSDKSVPTESYSTYLYSCQINQTTTLNITIHVTTELVNSTAYGIQSTVIGINIPYYISTANLDPDFSLLVDKGASDCDKKTGLTPGQIIGIIVGSILAVLVIVITITLLLRKKYKIVVDNKKIKMVTRG
eukprot:gene4969-5780_t